MTIDLIVNELQLNGYTGTTAVLLILGGVSFVLFGIRLMKPTLGVTGFLFFSGLAFTVLGRLQVQFGDQTELIYFAICLGAGLVGGAITVFLWRLGLALLGGLGGFSLSMFVLSFNPSVLMTNETYRFAFIGTLALIGALLPTFFEKAVIIVSTSIVGSFMLLLGVDFFAQAGFVRILPSSLADAKNYQFTNTTWGFIGSFAVVALLGMIVQYNVTGRKTKGYSKI